MSSSTNERSITKAKDRARQIANSNRGELLRIMSTPQGRTWMWTLIGLTGLYLADDDLSHAALARNAGSRNIGLRLTAELTTICPQSYIQMLVENSSANFTQEDESTND